MPFYDIMYIGSYYERGHTLICLMLEINFNETGTYFLNGLREVFGTLKLFHRWH